MVSSLITLFVLVFMLADVGLLIACLVVGPKMKGFCLLGLCVNGFFAVALVCLATVMILQTSDDQRSMVLLMGAGACAPWLLGFAAFTATYKWRMKEPMPQQSTLPK